MGGNNGWVDATALMDDGPFVSQGFPALAQGTKGEISAGSGRTEGTAGVRQHYGIGGAYIGSRWPAVGEGVEENESAPM